MLFTPRPILTQLPRSDHVPVPAPLFTALRHTLREGYSLGALRGDLAAGLTVGIIAIPLAMALAIAVGVPPQHGLYTVLVAAPLIALTGGSRFNISGPTAAFVVILLPITQQFGVGGLLLCTLMAGVILIAMGLAKMGKLIQFIPYPVTLGFTAGIGIVIATLQVKDLLGLNLAHPPQNYVEQLQLLANALPTAHLGDTLVALVCLAILIVWPRFVPRVPGHLVALAAGALLGLLLEGMNIPVATLGERFSYELNGVSHPGIPPSSLISPGPGNSQGRTINRCNYRSSCSASYWLQPLPLRCLAQSSRCFAP